MNEESDLRRITQWMDNEIEDDDVRDLLEENPGLMSDKETFQNVGKLLREQFPPEMEVPFPGGFNRQILRRIEEDADHTLEAQIHRFCNWLRLPDWGFPAAVSTALVTLLLAGTFVGNRAEERTRVVQLYAPNPAHSAEAVFVPKAEASLIEVSGLEPVSMEGQIAGFFPARADRNSTTAATVYYGADGEPLLVLSTNAAGEPRLVSLR